MALATQGATVPSSSRSILGDQREPRVPAVPEALRARGILDPRKPALFLEGRALTISTKLTLPFAEKPSDSL